MRVRHLATSTLPVHHPYYYCVSLNLELREIFYCLGGGRKLNPASVEKLIPGPDQTDEILNNNMI